MRHQKPIHLSIRKSSARHVRIAVAVVARSFSLYFYVFITHFYVTILNHACVAFAPWSINRSEREFFSIICFFLFFVHNSDFESATSRERNELKMKLLLCTDSASAYICEHEHVCVCVFASSTAFIGFNSGTQQILFHFVHSIQSSFSQWKWSQDNRRMAWCTAVCACTMYDVQGNITVLHICLQDNSSSFNGFTFFFISISSSMHVFFLSSSAYSGSLFASFNQNGFHFWIRIVFVRFSFSSLLRLFLSVMQKDLRILFIFSLVHSLIRIHRILADAEPNIYWRCM